MWPVAFAVTTLGAAEETTVRALVKQAVGQAPMQFDEWARDTLLPRRIPCPVARVKGHVAGGSERCLGFDNYAAVTSRSMTTTSSGRRPSR